MINNKIFRHDILLDNTEICNLQQDSDALLKGIVQGHRIVFIGRRNTGKTSLVKARIIPQFQNMNPKALVVFIDLMGVKTLNQISARFQSAFEHSISRLNPTTAFLKKLALSIRNLRPTMGIDALTGQPEFSLGVDSQHSSIPFAAIISEIGKYHIEHSALLVIDEFQDVHYVEEAEALFRNAFQQLPADLPVVAMGSKKSILAKIFAVPKAPLASWGRQYEISKISSEDYTPYFNERLNPVGCTVKELLMGALIQEMDGIPEAINLIGDWWQRHYAGGGELTSQDIFPAIAGVVEERHSLFLEHMKFYTEKEETFLRALARSQPVKSPLGSLFLSKLKMSPGGAGPLIKRLEADAIIYRQPEGFVIGDPILAHWLRRN